MLSQRSKAKEELREKIREENEAKELKECTFQPVLYTRRNSSGSLSARNSQAQQYDKASSHYS